MKLKEIVPELIVSDVSKSIKFYTEYLGFKIDMTAPDEKINWAQLSLDEYKIMFQEHNETKNEIENFKDSLSSTNIIVLRFDNKEQIKELYRKLLSNNIKIFMAIKETDYGSVEFGILDRDNYMIIISAD